MLPRLLLISPCLPALSVYLYTRGHSPVLFLNSANTTAHAASLSSAPNPIAFNTQHYKNNANLYLRRRFLPPPSALNPIPSRYRSHLTSVR